MNSPFLNTIPLYALIQMRVNGKKGNCPIRVKTVRYPC